MILKRFLGMLFVIAALIGILFSLLGIATVWRVRPAINQSVVGNLVLVDQTLTTTRDALSMVGQTIQITSIDVTSLQTTTNALAQAVQESRPGFDSLVTLTGKDIPAAITATQTALASAQASALLVDNTLSVLTSIPFLPVDAYAPAVPLHTALADISSSLDSFSPSLTEIHDSLVADQETLDTMQTELANVSDSTQTVSDILSNATTTIDQYVTVTSQLKANVENAQTNAPKWIFVGCVISSFILAWFMILQLSLWLQGLELLRIKKTER
jgi:hypothetical protein